MRRPFDEIDAIWKRLLDLERRATYGGGGLVASAHAANHAEGEGDEINITNIGGFSGNAGDVLHGDGTWGPAVGAPGNGQWIPVAVNNGLMLLNAEGHPVLVWWDGP